MRALHLDTAWQVADSVQLGRLTDVAVASDGTVGALDGLAAQVVVFAPDARLMTRFGSEGGGPGEFEPDGLSELVLTDSSIVVPDLIQQRLSEFSFSGALLGTRPFPGAPVYAVDWTAHPLGGLSLRVLGQRGDPLLRLQFTRLDTLMVAPTRNAAPNTVLGPVTLWRVLESGDILLGSSDQAELRRYSPRGDSLRWILRFEASPDPIGDEERRHIEDLLEESVARDGAAVPPDARAALLAQAQLPDRAPVVSGLYLLGPDRIWLRMAQPIPEMDIEALRVGSADGFASPVCLVLDESGSPVEYVRLPAGFTPRAWYRGWIYGVAEDDFGVQRPARVFAEGKP